MVAALDTATATAPATAPAPAPARRKETDLWLLERLVPGAGVNNLSLTFDVDGPLDRAALGRALTLVVRKHDILRTVFRAGETELVREVLDPAAVTVEVEEFRPDPAPERVQAEVEAFVAAPFALDGSPLLRAALFTTGSGGSVVSVALHHLVFDAMSTVTLLGELISAYEAPDGYATLPAVAAAEEPEPGAASVEFWREQLRGYRAPEGGLWFGNPPSEAPDLAGGSTWYALSAEARAVVARLQRELRAPQAVVLLAAYALLLSRHGAGQDIVVGSPVSVRPAGQEGAMGYHVNVLPLRVKVDPAKPFKRLVNRARSVFLEGLGHSGVPAESVLDEVRDSGGSGWRNSLCTHLFNYVPGGTSAEFAVAGHPARIRGVENGFSKFDLEFFFMPEGEDEHAETRIRAVYRTQAFGPHEVDLLLARYDALLVRLGEAAPTTAVGEIAAWGAEDTAAVEAGHRGGLPQAYAASPAVARFSRYARGELSGVRAYVAGPDGQELPLLVRGELHLTGPDGEPAPTAELARWLPDGRLELLGRKDRRVTVQGTTVPLDDIDGVLLAHPDVVNAATVAVPAAAGADPVLVSFVATTAAADLADRLLKQIRADLPGAAEPHQVVITDALPEVAGLPDLEGLALRAERLLREEPAAPEADGMDAEELADRLLLLWREYLKRDDLTVRSGFFASGGHSLLGIQLLQRVKRNMHLTVRVKLADLFAHPTPEKLATHIARTAA
ncbi:condensation domain-containing protein [Streptomyces sp. NPDC046876]|uniref:condensation domain-containing protein n=1 Tax=Streptomyces sp. NPDC046876 TaxID=3155616 RepID=UPI0033EBDB4E